MTIDVVINDCERLADQQEAIIKNIKNNLVGTPIKEYIDECSECSAYSRQIAEWLKELKEAKRLLKAAMEDMNVLYESGKDEGCAGIKFKWRYADEVEKLLGVG